MYTPIISPPPAPNYIYTPASAATNVFYPYYATAAATALQPPPSPVQHTQYYIQHQPPTLLNHHYQHHQQSMHLKPPPIATSLPNAAQHQPIKTEPQEFVIQHGIKPYFTNPISFKQEPSDAPFSSNQQQTQSQGRAKTSSSENDAAALNIVNHLLQDQQILNQLEKVAQSFRN